MAFTDFLNNGQNPSGTAFKSLTTTSTLPNFANAAGAQILSNQLGLMNTLYPTNPIPGVAGFTPTGQAGMDMTKAAASSYQPGLNAAFGATNAAAAAPGALTVANPYFGAAANTSVANIGAYMNPYTENVVNRIAELGGRNLSENIMPSIEGRYIGAGQLGGPTRGGGLSAAPSGMLTDTARAVRDTNADILGKQYEALSSGYSGALTAAGNDLNRMANIGSNVSNAASTEMRDRLAAGNQLGSLAAQEQGLGLAGANAVTGVGNAEMAKNQQNLDVARADRLRQLGYPQEQIDKAIATFGSLAPFFPKTSTEEGIVPVDPVAKTSTGQDIVSGALTGLGLFDRLFPKVLP